MMNSLHTDLAAVLAADRHASYAHEWTPRRRPVERSTRVSLLARVRAAISRTADAVEAPQAALGLVPSTGQGSLVPEQ